MAESADGRPDLGEEITRMVAAVQEWTRRTLPESTIGHGAECQWCPICQFVQVLRGEHPELTDRIAEAGTALTNAVRALAEPATRRTGDPRPRPTPRVERIDLGDG